MDGRRVGSLHVRSVGGLVARARLPTRARADTARVCPKRRCPIRSSFPRCPTTGRPLLPSGLCPGLVAAGQFSPRKAALGTTWRSECGTSLSVSGMALATGLAEYTLPRHHRRLAPCRSRIWHPTHLPPTACVERRTRRCWPTAAVVCRLDRESRSTGSRA